MTTILALLAVGCAIGYSLRSLDRTEKWIGKLTDISIYCLLFLLGVSVASTPGVSDNLLSLGIPSLVLSITGLLGSCLLAKITSRWFHFGR
jgi:uncharacterized membrane protein YbjE (DUF340 family)